MATLFSACDSEPHKPTNEVNNKLHENPHKVVYTLTEYRMPEGSHFAYDDLAKFRQVGNVQKLTWQIKSDATWAFVEEQSEFEVKTTKDAPEAIYKLSIEYFNPSGVAMNHQFIDNGQDKIHQHLFSTYRNGLLVREASKIAYEYLYADRDKSTGKYLGEENPIGLEGFFRFKDEFALQKITAILLHAYKSKYRDGKPSPFYAQSLEIQGDHDISVDLVFRAKGNTDRLEGDGSTSPENTPKPDDNKTDTPTSGGINKTDVKTVKFFFAEGHFHGTQFHYLPGPQNLKYKNFGYEQSMTATWDGGQWLFSGDVKLFLLHTAKLYRNETYPAPAYGLWLEYYDKDNQLVSSRFVGEGQYQTFFRPTDIKSLSEGEPLDIKPEELLSYHYKDTDPYDKTVKLDRAKDVSATNPIGLKGFLFSYKTDVQFTCNIELWSTPQGKTSEGKLSSAVEPSEHIQQTGQCVLRIPIPMLIWFGKDDKYASLIPEKADEDEEHEHTTTAPHLHLHYLKDYPDEFTEQDKAMLNNLMKVLGINFKILQEQLYLNFYGKRASEGSGLGRWF